MANLQLKVDYFLDARIQTILNESLVAGDATHVLLYLASQVVKKDVYDGESINVRELECAFEDFGPSFVDDILEELMGYGFIEVDLTGKITVLENNLWELV